MLNIMHVVGARPNFMKVAPVITSLQARHVFKQVLVHTGQHYDMNLSKLFFDQLDLPEPDINLEVGSGSHAAQTAQIMIRFEEVISKEKPCLVLVYGDVNSTVAAALVCAKLLIPVGHVEAGLRSFDRTMPEEINRIMTDQIADLLFTPSADGDENLVREGIAQEKIYFVGNVMIDTLLRLEDLAEKKFKPSKLLDDNLTNPDGAYALVTLHRPSNVDDIRVLGEIIDTLDDVSNDIPILFPIHPRTRAHLRDLGVRTHSPRFRLMEPVGYLQFLLLQKNAAVVITDSGGIQEETTFLGIPCLTVRENTERPITVELGTNILVGQNMDRLKEEVHNILNGKTKKGKVPPLWDGKAGERIVDVITSTLLQ